MLNVSQSYSEEALLGVTPNSSMSLSIRFSNAWHKLSSVPSRSLSKLENPMNFEALCYEDPPYSPSAPPNVETNIKETKLIRITRPFRIRWDLLTMLMSLYNCITVPLFLAFEIEETTALVVLNNLADVVFVSDLILNFFTTYIDSSGEEVLELRKIVIEYLKFMFWIDLVSAVPFDIILLIFASQLSIPEALNLTDMVKTIRVLRLNRMIRFMRSKSEHKSIYRLVIMMLYLLLWVHFASCIWYGLARINGEWTPVNSWPYGEIDIYSLENYKKYVYSFYHGVWCLRGNELGPRDYKMACIGGLLMICGSMVTAILFGEIAVIMGEMTRKSTNFQNTIENCLTTATELKLSSELTDKILDYVTSSKAQQNQQSEFESFTNLISPSLQSKVRACLYGNLLITNKVLSSNPQAAQAIAKLLKQKLYKPEEAIVTEGMTSDSMFFIVRGEVCVWVVDSSREKKPVCFLGDGAHFGEIGLLYKTLRTATVTSQDFSTVAQLMEEDFNEIVHQYPNIIDSMRKLTEEYEDPWKLYLIENFVRANYFNYLPKSAIHELVYLCDVDWVKPGNYLFKPGDKANRAYLVTEGLLEISCTINEKSLHVMKRKYKMDRIERAPTVERRRKHEVDYSLWNLELSDITLLKPCYEVLPLMNEAGVVVSKFYGESNPPNFKTIGDYPQEIVLEYCERGTLLNTELILIDYNHELQCRALKLSKVYSFNTDLIHELAVRHPRFDNFIVARKDKLNSIWESVVNPIDVKTKSVNSKARRMWKSAIIRVILRSRKARLQGAWKIVDLVTKIRAILACENAGKFELAQKVIQDVIPPHYITEEGSLDPSCSIESVKQVVTSTHPVMQIFKKLQRDITEPKGVIQTLLSSLARITKTQGMKLFEMKQDIFEAKMIILDLLEKFDAPRASMFRPQLMRFATSNFSQDKMRQSIKTRVFSMQDFDTSR
mmetsp:Transcript_25770/g.45381  ORF Transcript_25770/g.45381 Transcript_25770/m.45381 type:complete len:948 (-) Transcript_25770:2606-5449(-)